MRSIFLVILSLSISPVFAQLLTEEPGQFTKADTLRGMLSPLRTCYDVHHYDLNITVDPGEKKVFGSNTISFFVVEDFDRFQIDLFENMEITKIEYEGEELDFDREFNAVFVNFPRILFAEDLAEVTVYYSGEPIVAERAPWDGGFVWAQDSSGHPWIGVACEGIGASLWWPNKDHLSDEPDSMMIRVAVPEGLMDVSNGQLVATHELVDGWTRYDWRVTYPINNYNVTVNIGPYENFKDYYVHDGDSLLLDYYVMPENVERAKEHFLQVKPMMDCYYKYLGPYPFERDGFKLVETPYLGMEHQSAIAYGNKYKTGYDGYDYSKIGLDFDYIIIHEAGHEWWGNSVSCADIADLWIHEGFCTYSEALYTECLFGYDTAMLYVNAKKPGVKNTSAIIGTYNVNSEGSGDMYNKGMLILNTIRHVVNNDEQWFDMIRGIVNEFEYSTTSTDEIVNYINGRADKNLTPIFDQYLKHPAIPVFEYKVKKRGKEFHYRWNTNVEEFDMPLLVQFGEGEFQWVDPRTNWQQMEIDMSRKDEINVAEDKFYIVVRKVK